MASSLASRLDFENVQGVRTERRSVQCPRSGSVYRQVNYPRNDRTSEIDSSHLCQQARELCRPSLVPQRLDMYHTIEHYMYVY